MKYLYALLLLTTLVNQPVMAQQICRDRFNFMSSWYELHLVPLSDNGIQNEISGQLVFITAQGQEVLQAFHLELSSIKKGELKYTGDSVSLRVKRGRLQDLVEFSSSALERPFSEGFKCPKGDGVLNLSGQGGYELSGLFQNLNLPVITSNGGFREIRRSKLFVTPDNSFSFDMHEIGVNRFSYELKVDLMNSGINLKSYNDAEKDLYVILFNKENSRAIRSLLKNFEIQDGSLMLDMLEDGKFLLRCLKSCALSVFK